MTRRVSLPGASELFFRTTAAPSSEGKSSSDRPAAAPALEQRAGADASNGKAARKKHDTKITVYLSSEQVLALEHARLSLRGTHDMAVDRGKLVRESIAVLLEDFERNGEDSVLVRRLLAEQGEPDRPGP